jgi:DNA-binding NtrC family response regulator
MDKATVVLVVEDEPLLLLMATALVEEAGLQPLYAGNADEAVAILEAREDIRIVFTDVEMPGSMDGIKLAAAIRDRWPPIRIVVVSGHSAVRPPELPEGALFFAKPYDQQRIVETLQALAA